MEERIIKLKNRYLEMTQEEEERELIVKDWKNFIKTTWLH